MDFKHIKKKKIEIVNRGHFALISSSQNKLSIVNHG